MMFSASCSPNETVENCSKNSKDNDETNEAKTSPRKIIDAAAELLRPERVKNSQETDDDDNGATEPGVRMRWLEVPHKERVFFI
jgi:hypothetical protein